MSCAAPHRTVVLGAALAALLLLTTAPTPGSSVHRLHEAGSATDPTAPLVALLSLLAWVLAAWLLMTVAVTAGSHLPGLAGRALARLARRTAPATLRRAVEAGLGLTVAMSVLGAAPASASPAAPAAPAAVNLDWAAPVPPLADLDWAAAPAAPPPAGPAAVVVQPGDSLWALAEQHLADRGEPTTDTAVAQAWPAWWAANRDVVGDDPDLLHPGTELLPPAGGAATASS